MRITESQLRRIIRQEVRALRESNLSPGPSPHWTAVVDAWTDLAGADRRPVPIEELEAALGVGPDQIRWHGTGLRLMGGLVTELL